MQFVQNKRRPPPSVIIVSLVDVLMVVLIFCVNVRVSYRMIEGIKKDFYSGSTTAKKERAFRVFYRHWSRGVGAIRDNPKPGLLLGRWDLETMSS